MNLSPVAVFGYALALAVCMNLYLGWSHGSDRKTLDEYVRSRAMKVERMRRLYAYRSSFLSLIFIRGAAWRYYRVRALRGDGRRRILEVAFPMFGRAGGLAVLSDEPETTETFGH